MKKKIVITGGHGPSAFAVIEEILKEKNQWQIFYFGRKYLFGDRRKLSLEYNELKDHQKVKFISLTTGKLNRYLKVSTIVNLLKIPFGFINSFSWLLKIRPDLIVSFGGYLSVPVIISGWILRIPSISHEQTRSIGLANRINSFFVKKMAISFPEVKKQISSSKIVLTGNPMTQQEGKLPVIKKHYLYKILSAVKNPILFVTGGKTGSKAINKIIEQSKEELKKNFFVLHQIGVDPDINPKKEDNYLSIRLIEDVIYQWVLDKANLVIARSGANTVWRLMASNKKAILIPLPICSGDEQLKNAQFLEKVGLAEIVNQERLNPKLLFKAINRLEKKREVKYPSWWKKAEPRGAAKRVWQLAKGVLENNVS